MFNIGDRVVCTKTENPMMKARLGVEGTVLKEEGPYIWLSAPYKKCPYTATQFELVSNLDLVNE